MSTYSAYFHKERALDGSGLVVFKEKFNWFALFLPLFWSLRYQLWLAFFSYILVSLAIQVVLEMIGSDWVATAALTIALRVLFALSAPFFRRRKLENKGYRELNPVHADCLEVAERKTLDGLLTSFQENNKREDAS